METVISVNLNGNAYQVDESGHKALADYLARAGAALANNPDKAEILRDLEQAIADKAGAYLSASKTVLSAAEIGTILQEMGPVEGEGGEEASTEAPRAGEPGKKRLFRLRDDAMIAGICSGLAAYFSLDVTIIRILMVLGVFLTAGWLILAYVIAMFIIPSAHTSEEWAQAHGLAFNAQGVVDEAKRRYAEFQAEGGVRSHWRARRREWRAWRRRMNREWRHDVHGWTGAPPATPAQPVGYVTRVFAGLIAFIFAILGAALTIAFIIAVFTLATTGALLGWAPPASMPLWLAIIILCIVFAVISTPVRAIRRASYAALNGRATHGHGDGFAGIVFVALIVWLLWLFVPASHDWFEAIPDALRSFANMFRLNAN